MKPLKLSKSQVTHLKALPYSVAWWGGKVHAKPFAGFNSKTHDALAERGFLRRVGGSAGCADYATTAAGRGALQIIGWTE